jgi:hypothetical protein
MMRRLKASMNKSVNPIAKKVDHTKDRLSPIANKVSKLKLIVKSSQEKRKSMKHHRLKKSKKATAVVLSLPTGPYYAGCTSNNEYSDNDWSCAKGLVGTMLNSP